jgi:hypothetical protein
MYNYFDIDVNRNGWFNIGFQLICAKGLTEIAQWLQTVGDTDTCDYVRTFKSTCYNRNPDTAKWIYSLGVIDNDTLCGQFERMCYMGILEIAQWIYDVGEFNDISSLIEELLIDSEVVPSNIRDWLMTL